MQIKCNFSPGLPKPNSRSFETHDLFLGYPCPKTWKSYGKVKYKELKIT